MHLSLCREANTGSVSKIVQPTKKRKKSSNIKLEVFDKDLKGLPERLGDRTLRAIIVGTNPSGHAW